MANKSCLFVVLGLCVGAGTAQAQILKSSRDLVSRPDRRPADARVVEYLVGPLERFEVAYDRGAYTSDPANVNQVAAHQAGVLAVPMEAMRGKAPIVPASLPSGPRPLLFEHVGPALGGCWLWQLVPGIGGGWESDLTHNTPLSSIAKPAALLAAPQTAPVTFQIDKNTDGRMRIKAMRGEDNTALFDAFADVISLNSALVGQIVLSGNVEIRSHQGRGPRRILAARVILNIGNGTFEVMGN